MNNALKILAVAAFGWSGGCLSAGVLEIPSAGPTGDLSVESGIGLISGWHCTAKRVQIVIDDLPPIDAPHGSSRDDTASVCAGTTATGFALLFNWNVLSPGLHTVRALADGVEFGRTRVYATNLGSEFLTGVPVATYRLPNFPAVGMSADVQWSEAKQNMSILFTYPLALGGTYYGALMRNGVAQHARYDVTVTDGRLSVDVSYTDGTSCTFAGTTRVGYGGGGLTTDAAKGSCAFCVNASVDGRVLEGALGEFNVDSPPAGCMSKTWFAATKIR
jgi:hypothetical protein